MREILRWIQGWSTKKKVLWGIVAGFLFLVCVGAIASEPVEDTTTSGGASSAAKQHELVEEFGCQWIMDAYRPFADLGREMAVLSLSTDMALKRDNLTHIGTGDAAEALRECEAAGWR